MLIKDLNTSIESIKNIVYHNDGYTIKIINNLVQKVAGDIYIKRYIDKYNDEYFDIFIVKDRIGITIGNKISFERISTVENLISLLKEQHFYDYDDFINYNMELSKSNCFIRDTVIEFVKQFDTEKAKKLYESKLEYKKQKEITKQIEDLEKQNKEKERIKLKEKELEKIIHIVENKIRNREQLYNNTVKLLNGNETTIVLLLMKKYGIKIPLKTWGLINKALYSLLSTPHEYSYDYYGGKNGSKDSTVFIKYLKELIQKIDT